MPHESNDFSTYFILAHNLDSLKCNYIEHMDFYFCLPLYGQFPTTNGLFR